MTAGAGARGDRGRGSGKSPSDRERISRTINSIAGPRRFSFFMPPPPPRYPMREPMTRDTTAAQGILEMHPKGYGFLRSPAKNYTPQPGDAYVGAPVIQKYH